MQSVQVWRHERAQWIHAIRNEIGLAEIVEYVDFRDHDFAKWALKKRQGRSIEVSPDFLLIFPRTATYRICSVACEFADTVLSEHELKAKAKTYAETFVDGVAIIQRFCGGQDQFFELSGYDFDGLRSHELPDENSAQHVSFIEWSKNLYHAKPAPKEN